MSVTQETNAISAISSALDSIEDENGRFRVLRWAIDAYGLPTTQPRLPGARQTAGEAGGGQGDAEFADVSQFVEAVGASESATRLIAVAYFHQMVLGEGDWPSMTINSDLKHIGHPSANITTALDRLAARRPAWVRQVKKKGKAKQSRKLFSLTSEGQRAVQSMLSGESPE